MAISVADSRLLWGRAGGFCSICQIRLSEDPAHAGPAYPIGEQAHIVGAQTAAARGTSPLTAEERDRYSNLILVCPNCHTKIDRDPITFPVERLHILKREHELRIEAAVTPPALAEQVTTELYAAVIDSFVEGLQLHHWREWIGPAASYSPPIAMTYRTVETLEAFVRAISIVVWPGRFPELEAALRSTSESVERLLNVFLDEAEQDPKRDDWLSYRLMLRRTLDYNVDHVEGMRWSETFEETYASQVENLRELTKNVNLVAGLVRSHINPRFFALEGKFGFSHGPYGLGEMAWEVPEH